MLLLANSDEVENKISQGNSRIDRMFKEKPLAMIEELYLATFARFPTAPEIINAEAHIAKDPDVRKGVEDVLWSLVNSQVWV